MTKKKSKNFNISFVVLLIGVFMAALDNGIISPALTTINADLVFQQKQVLGVLHSIH